MSGMVAVVPVAMTTACRAISVRAQPSVPTTSTDFSPASRPWPLMTSMPVSWAQVTWLVSSWSLVNESRRRSTAAVSML